MPRWWWAPAPVLPGVLRPGWMALRRAPRHGSKICGHDVVTSDRTAWIKVEAEWRRSHLGCRPRRALGAARGVRTSRRDASNAHGAGQDKVAVPNGRHGRVRTPEGRGRSRRARRPDGRRRRAATARRRRRTSWRRSWLLRVSQRRFTWFWGRLWTSYSRPKRACFRLCQHLTGPHHAVAFCMQKAAARRETDRGRPWWG
jgi:hypothetical protein